MGKYTDLAEKIGKLVDDKNKAYGSSFDQAGDFLKLLYPNGIPVDAYTDALCIVRIFDKLKRLSNTNGLPANEGKIDAWKDIVGYGLLGLYKDGGSRELETESLNTPVQKTIEHVGVKKEIIPAVSETESSKQKKEEVAPVKNPNCAICGREVEGTIPPEEIAAGKTIVHADCWNKYLEQKGNTP
ncbi:hypothetical protein EBU71_06570 [bacterium]|jgi:hypothetical protein|nr:hypothetical protein [Candidatus Elulimicrobium humile]